MLYCHVDLIIYYLYRRRAVTKFTNLQLDHFDIYFVSAILINLSQKSNFSVNSNCHVLYFMCLYCLQAINVYYAILCQIKFKLCYVTFCIKRPTQLVLTMFSQLNNFHNIEYAPILIILPFTLQIQYSTQNVFHNCGSAF